ncbi:MAG: outer membrane beta-barrel protein [Gemmatimonadota bacterium]
MRPIRSLPAALLLVVAIGPTGQVAAQEPPPAHVSVAAGLFQYEVGEADGLAPMLALRVGSPISSVLLVEGSLVAARPDDSALATALIPEVQVQLSLPFTGVNPYMGLGAGVAALDRGEGWSTDLTISGALGVKMWLNDQWGVMAEFRGRGMGTDFGNTSAEYTVGVSRSR